VINVPSKKSQKTNIDEENKVFDVSSKQDKQRSRVKEVPYKTLTKNHRENSHKKDENK
jgi:hypothetical protein